MLKSARLFSRKNSNGFIPLLPLHTTIFSFSLHLASHSFREATRGANEGKQTKKNLARLTMACDFSLGTWKSFLCRV